MVIYREERFLLNLVFCSQNYMDCLRVSRSFSRLETEHGTKFVEKEDSSVI